VAAVLRFAHLGDQSLWIDEVFTWLSAGGQGDFGLAAILANVHGPLHSAVLHLVLRVFGDSEWALRMPSAVAGVALVPAMAWLARGLAGPAAVAPAAWLTAASPFLVWYSQEARNYAFLLLFSTLALAALLSLQQRFTRAALVGHVVAGLAASLSNLSFALILPFHLKLWLTGPAATRAARRRVVLVAVGVLLLCALPWLPSIVGIWDWSRLAPGGDPAHHGEPLRGTTTFHPAALPWALHSMAVGYTLGPTLRALRGDPGWATLAPHGPVLAAAALTFAALGWLGLRALARRGRLADTLLGLLVPAVLVSYFATQNFKVFHPRYLAVSVPLFVVVCAAGFAEVRGRPRAVLAAAVGALWALSLGHLHFDPAYGREDYRGALRAVRADWREGAQVVAVGSEEPVFYYGRDLPVVRWWLGHVDRPDRMQETWQALESGARASWVVLSREEDLDPGGRFARFLAERYPDAMPRQWAGVRVWHLEHAAARTGAPTTVEAQ
jgi:4-amino-4-deoxy-L-arabinose transferase-like glycosyltransferase